MVISSRGMSQGPYKFTLIGPEVSLMKLFLYADEIAPPWGRGYSFDRVYPVFVPTRRRALTAHLNWEASHVFGRSHSDPPLVIGVIEPGDVDPYTTQWPELLFMVLPEDNLGPGFMRFAIQSVATRATIPKTQCPEILKAKTFKLPYFWMVDDTVSSVYRLQELSEATVTALNVHNQGRVRVLKQRVGVQRGFLNAMLTMQGHSMVRNCAITGMLRDDGTACCKKMSWKSDTPSCHKLVLCNTEELTRLGVFYEPGLRLFEDVHLPLRVLEAGGRTLKTLAYAYRASHRVTGGAEEVRQCGRITNDRIMSPATFISLPPERKESVLNVMRWAQRREDANAMRVRTQSPKTTSTPSASESEPTSSSSSSSS